jgi:hypothetical protein
MELKALIINTSGNLKGYIFIFILFAYVFFISYLHNYRFMKSKFYLQKIKTRSYFFELGFYLLLTFIFVISLLLLSFILIKVIGIPTE